MRIFVSNLAYTTTAHELRQLFVPYGVVVGGYILQDRETGQALAWIPTSLKVPKFLGNRRLKVQKKT